MKNFLLFLFITFFLSGNAFEKYGKGRLKLSDYTMENLLMYMYGAGNTKYSGDAKRKNDPTVIAISDDGLNSAYFYCPAQYRAYGCMDNHTKRKAITNCEKRSNGSSCYIFAVKRRIVWKNGGKKTKIKSEDLKSPYVVAKKIKEAGFYDGDLTKIAGISIETGQIDEDIKIIGKEVNSSTTTTKSEPTDIVKDLEALTKLFIDGVLTKEEFQKAKKRLLNN